jgi:DNA-binding XRE family transcriptional regulator
MPKQNTRPADYPLAVLQQIEQLAQNIAIARKRRGETQAQWAKKLGVSQPTMARIERGDPSVAMASYVMCMWLINQGSGLADLVAPQNDHAALEREVANVRAKRKPSKVQSAQVSYATPQTLTQAQTGQHAIAEPQSTQASNASIHVTKAANIKAANANAQGLAALITPLNKPEPETP